MIDARCLMITVKRYGVDNTNLDVRKTTRQKSQILQTQADRERSGTLLNVTGSVHLIKQMHYNSFV